MYVHNQFAEMLLGTFALQKLLTFFQQKNGNIFYIKFENFNISLSNGIIWFEQLGPDVFSTCNNEVPCLLPLSFDTTYMYI